MRFGIASNPVSDRAVPVAMSGDFCDVLRDAGEMGYDVIEIHVPDVSALDIPRIREAMKRTGVGVATLGTGTIYGTTGLHLCDGSEENRERLHGMLRRFVDVAAQLGARVTLGSVKGNIPPGADREKSLALLGRSLRRIDEYAARQGVTLLVEATNRYENNVLNTGRQVADIIRLYELSSTRALLDVFHMNIEEADPLRALEDAKEVLGHVHVADNNRLFPGAGCFAFAPFARKLREIGYDGVVSVECLPLPTGEEAAKSAIGFLRELFD